MNHPPDEPSDIDDPPTRALLPTDPVVKPPGESGSTLEADTRKFADGGGRPDDQGPGPGTEAQLAPGLGSSAGGSSGGTTRRGVVGKIEPGQTLYAKFLVLRRLGGGAMGDVWLVRHVILKSEHALKVIVPNIASNNVALMRFQREFEVMASLRHEHAVSIYDACIDEDGGYIDMEYVEGRTLHEVLSEAKRRPGRDPSAPLMPLGWIDRVLDQLTDVLQVAEKGVVHRDLKPSNMMLLGGRRPGKEYLKVLDFGIAKIRDDPDNVANRGEGEPKTVGFIGTPSYGSPEQALSRDDIDGRSDIYSVAVLLYEFVSGHLPFTGNHWQIMHQHASVPAPLFAETAPDLRPLPEIEQVILRALSKDRDRRPPTARDLYEEFHRAALAIQPNLADHPSSFTPSGSWDAASGVVASPPLSTEHDGLATYRPASEQPATLSAAHSPEPTRKTTTRPPRKPRPDHSDDLGPVIEAGRGRPRIWPWACAAVVFAGLGVSIGFLMIGSVGGPIADGRPAVVGTSKRADDAPRSSTWEDYLPGGFDAVKGYVDNTRWPAKIRRTSDVVTFYRDRPGIYLPEGYRAENDKDLEDGWPGAIVREGDPSRARYLRIRGGVGWTMGAWDAEPSRDRADTPAHPVVVSGHYVAETEVTNGQFEDFLRQTDRAAPDAWEAVFLALKKDQKPEAARKHPAVNVSRQQAQEYAHFARGRLPTEAQWEFDARSGGEQRRYVWGDMRPSRDLARIDIEDGGGTAPVGSFPGDKTRQGAFDFNGNVQEWCRDAWQPYRASDRAEVNPCGVAVDKATAEFVVRGASFSDLSYDSALTRRLNRAGDDVAENVGFRVVIECPDARKPRP